MTFSRSTAPRHDSGISDMAPVFLWATPRSVSTAFERVMKNSAELHALHEPFTDAYYFGPERKSSRYGERDAQDFIADREAIEASIRDRPPHSRAFVKELAFQGEPYVSDHMLRTSHQLVITRQPAAVYASLSRLKPDFTEDEFGFTALRRLVDRLDNMGRNALVMDGDVFREDPTGTTSRVCRAISVTFDPDMLFWTEGRIRQWENGEEKSQAIWHGTLESSHTILKPAGEQRDVDILPRHVHWYERALGIYHRLTAGFETSDAGHDKNSLSVS